GAADAGRDAEAGQFETVSDVGRGRLVGETGPMQRGEQEVTGTVTGEHATGAVGPVRRGRQPDDQHRCLGITERWNRATPVDLVTERSPLLPSHPLPPLDEPGTETALDQIHDPTLASVSVTLDSEGNRKDRRPDRQDQVRPVACRGGVRPVHRAARRLNQSSEVAAWAS